MKETKGDLVKMFLDGEFDVIVHGCNCKGIMGAGLAKQIAEQIPEAVFADKMYKYRQHDYNKLSDYSIATVRRENGKIGFVINLYTQYSLGPDLYENALLLGFEKLRMHLQRGIKIGIPAIGCGIAGGKWDEIGPKIAKIMSVHDITYVEYEKITE